MWLEIFLEKKQNYKFLSQQAFAPRVAAAPLPLPGSAVSLHLHLSLPQTPEHPAGGARTGLSGARDHPAVYRGLGSLGPQGSRSP